MGEATSPALILQRCFGKTEAPRTDLQGRGAQPLHGTETCPQVGSNSFIFKNDRVAAPKVAPEPGTALVRDGRARQPANRPRRDPVSDSTGSATTRRDSHH